MLKLAVTGAAGRMGRRIVALAHESDDFEVAAAMEAPGNTLLGADAGEIAGIGSLGVKITEQPGAGCDVMIDFSLPAGTEKWAEYCRREKLPLVVGTTGLSDAQKQMLQATAQETAVLLGANMSLGVNLLFKLAGEVAKSLGSGYDLEVIETHHRFKRDAPSGTALELARQMALAQNWPFPDCLTHGREGKQTLREEKTIGMHAVRAGDVIGDHRVLFSALGETVELHHRAHSRDTFVRGALRAAKWISGKQPGMYSMADVLGL